MDKFHDSQTCPCPFHKAGDPNLLVATFLDQYPEILNPKFTSWYKKALVQIGPYEFDRLALRSKEGTTPAYLFRSLLKKALGGNI